VKRLEQAGIDVYGVDTRPELALAGAEGRLDVRADAALDHLRNVGEGALGGVVLSGCVDAVRPERQLELADLAVAAVAPGGHIVVLSIDPRTWAATRPPAEVDLAAGRPLRAETWQTIFEQRGLQTVTLLKQPPPALAAVDAGSRELAEAALGSGAYAVVVTR
jgi:hypothetical protein